MVLQPPLVAARWVSGRAAAFAGAGFLALLGACGKGPGSTATSTPTVGAHEEQADPSSGSGSTPAAAPTVGPNEAGVEELYVDGVRLRLQPAGCVLTAVFLDQEHRHRFEPFPASACHFAPDQHGQPWVVPTEHGKAVLVESSVPAEGDDCETALQIVVVTERGPQLSREIQHVSGCGPGPWDEMMYHVLASDRVALGAG